MKKLVITVVSVLLLTVLVMSLVGCMSVRMTEKSIVTSLSEGEYVIMENHSMIPTNNPEMVGTRIEKCIYAYKEDLSDPDNILAKYEVAIYFMRDKASADKVEKIFETMLAENNNHYETYFAEGNTSYDAVPKRYILYRHDDTVIFGDWQSVTLIRGY